MQVITITHIRLRRAEKLTLGFPATEAASLTKRKPSFQAAKPGRMHTLPTDNFGSALQQLQQLEAELRLQQ